MTDRSFRDVLVPSSIPAFALWRVWPPRRGVVVRLKSGIRIRMEKGGAPPLGNDYGCAYEVFVHEYYRPPASVVGAANGIRTVVDLGANVGFTALYFLGLFAQARVIAVEPHPQHLAAMAENLRLNGAADHVEIVAAAAGVAAGRARLSDQGTGSQVSSAGTLDVPVVDIFAVFAGRPVDLLKIDIEGGEYAILEDARFAALRPPFVVMEWHETADAGGGRRRCRERLASLGYAISDIFDHGDHGMIWAIR